LHPSRVSACGIRKTLNRELVYVFIALIMAQRNESFGTSKIIFLLMKELFVNFAPQLMTNIYEDETNGIGIPHFFPNFAEKKWTNLQDTF
jgi:hypothetical protein